MPDWTGFPASRHFDHVVAHEVARAVRKGKAAAGSVAVPWTCLQAEQIMAKVEMNRDAFALSPFAVWIEEKRLGVRQGIWINAFLDGHWGTFLDCFVLFDPFQRGAGPATIVGFGT